MADIKLYAHDNGLMVQNGSAAPWAIHPLWLRERCCTTDQMDPATQQRLYNPSDLTADLRIVEVQPGGAGSFRVAFSDGVAGLFETVALLREIEPCHDDPEPVAWNAGQLPPAAVNWASCDQDAIRLRVLAEFLSNGYVIFQGVGSVPGSVLDVARSFGFPRETNFGALFDVRSVPSASDLAYTPLPLDPHTDNPYRAPVPGIQLLHCLVNETPGGLSTLVDGLAVAEALRTADTAAFDCLSRVPVRFRYVDAGTELIASATLIELTAGGRFAAINYSPRLDFVPLLPPDELERFYAARRLLDGMLKSAAFERRFKLNDGDLMMFDNRRLLHGRTGFDPQAGLRHLQGCYIDADGPRSQYRVLRRSVV